MRGEALAQRIAAIDLQAHDAESKLSAITLGFVDALLVADGDALEAALAELRERLAQSFESVDKDRLEARGWLLGLAAMARWGLERLPSPSEIALRADGQAARFLRALEGGQTQTSAQLQNHVGTGDSQISRIGKDLVNHGLVVQRRVGRHAFWELTPRGRQAVQQLARDATAQSNKNHAKREHRSGRSRTAGAVSSRSGQTAYPQAAAMFVDAPQSGVKRAKRNEPVRSVVPHKDGGWAVAMADGGRSIERFSAKKDAVKRGQEIVSRAGGGTLHVYDRDGNQKTKSVGRST